MIQRLVAVLFTAAALACAAAPGMPSREALPGFSPLAASFRAPALAPSPVVALPAPVEKAAPAPDAEGPRRVASVRELDAPAYFSRWVAVPGGYVAKARASSSGALGLRIRLDLGPVPGDIDVRAQGTDGRIETMIVDPARGPDAWTPWTEGSTQLIELFSRVRPESGDAVAIGAVLHFDAPLVPKAAGTCTLETMCATTDTSLDATTMAAIAQREKSVVRMQFVVGGSGFVCTGTLINTQKFPAPYVLTANHCIASDSVARTVSARWFYVSDQNCPDQGVAPPYQQTTGAQLVFTNYNVDSTLLLMNAPPPDGAVYSGWNAAQLSPGDAVVSVSHPDGDTARYAVGATDVLYRLNEWPQEFYGVHFSRGIIQGGSSGSGLFTLSALGELQLRGILTGTTVTGNGGGLSCSNLNEDGLYSRLEIFEPEIEPYITTAGRAPDDAPNRIQDFAGVPVDFSGPEVLDKRTTPLAYDNRRIDYPGDLDVYRFELTTPAWVSAWTEGPNIDTIGTLYDSFGAKVDVNDDAQTGDNHFGITRQVGPGTYYLQVAHWLPAGTGAYNLRMRADQLDTNYTDLWWNPAESGWGINLNHQGNVIFATLFTYDAGGVPMWLVMSDGERQADGTYSGALYRTTGPAFNAVPFGSVSAVAVGSMRLAFPGPDSATLTYTFNGTPVTKIITRQSFATPAPSCSWSAFDRSFANNFQDLWWNPAEPGWGVNIAHQGDTLFATLFTYDASGKAAWFVMSNGSRTGAGSYSGTLYRTSGPAFNAVPWTPINATPVGSMSFTFTNGNAGSMTYSVDGVPVTKTIQRQVFRDLKTDCES